MGITCSFWKYFEVVNYALKKAFHSRQSLTICWQTYRCNVFVCSVFFIVNSHNFSLTQFLAIFASLLCRMPKDGILALIFVFNSLRLPSVPLSKANRHLFNRSKIDSRSFNVAKPRHYLCAKGHGLLSALHLLWAIAFLMRFEVQLVAVKMNVSGKSVKRINFKNLFQQHNYCKPFWR